MTHTLDVWLFSDYVGSLSQVNGRLNFCYATAWLAEPKASALSCALPLQATPFDDHQSRPFFAGLLPEGKMRRLIAQRFQVSGQNDFALLDYLGGECAGAVTLRPPGSTLPESDENGEIEWLSDDALISVLDELPQRPMLAGHDGLRLSLAGAQDKLPVVFDGQHIGLPRNGTPSSHILKPAIQSVEDSVSNEGFCMVLADAMQLKPAHAQIHSVRDRQFLLVERYDRMRNAAGNLQRLHQEDFCQALGVVPEMKYQNEGGPDLALCFDLVRRMTRPNAPQVLRLLDLVIFNALIGNHDAHGKNFSLLYTGKSPVLAPFYDLLSTAVYPTLTPKMAMKLGSRYKFSEVEVRHWMAFAESAGLSASQTQKRILTIAQTLPLAAQKLQARPDHKFSGNPLIEQIISLIEQRAALTIRRLSSPSN